MTAFRSFPDVFTEVAARYPHSPALIEQGRVACTYAELLRGAMSLAQYLRGLGVGREDAVGLALGQSADHVVGMLGVWLAGAAFVPLDPDLPHERREFILSRARVRTVLDSLPVGHDSNRDAPPCHDWNRNPRKADDLAYIIFTSGSTGGPKGVEVTHRGIVNCLQAQMPIFGLTHHCRALFYLSPSFDASISDIGTALLAGAALCIEPGIRRAPGGVMALLRERGITHADLPPSLLAMLNPDELPESVRTIIIGGEVCPPEVVRRWARRVRLVNVYGPTEATICTSLGVCDPDTWDRPLLGHPIPNIGY